jgi:hypothetical protein
MAISDRAKEGKVMAEQILVCLERHDWIEDFVPYIEHVARPGTKVIFLMRNSIESWQHLKDHWITAESAREAMLAGQEIIATYSSEAQRRWAEQKISSERRAFENKGLEVVVEIYRGALRKAIKNYLSGGGVHLVMIRAGMKSRILRLLPNLASRLGSLRRYDFSPILLLRLHHLET